MVNPEPATCTLSINICLTDLPYLSYIVPHIVKACRYPFAEKMLVIDTAPMKGRYKNGATLPSMSELEAAAQCLVEQGYIDAVVKVDYSPSVRDKIIKKHLGYSLWETHDFRDAPIYAYLFAYEAAKSDYFLHFDADMLLYQAEGYNWIEEGIKYLKQCPEILTITPLAGPPNADLSLKQRDTEYAYNEKGFFTFKVFTARRYLLDRHRFDSFLPLPVSYISKKRELASWLTRRSAMERWEGMITNKLHATQYIRADIASPKAWTLHALEHNAKFLELLPYIIKQVEAGSFPQEQAGDYDLQLELWQG